MKYTYSKDLFWRYLWKLFVGSVKIVIIIDYFEYICKYFTSVYFHFNICVSYLLSSKLNIDELQIRHNNTRKHLRECTFIVRNELCCTLIWSFAHIFWFPFYLNVILETNLDLIKIYLYFWLYISTQHTWISILRLTELRNPIYSNIVENYIC